jgi:hypothetical protein
MTQCNETRALSLMPLLRVTSGTHLRRLGAGTCDASFHLSRVLGCRLQPPPGGGALDVSEPDQPLLAGVMGKPTRNELLAEYYLRAAGVAAVRRDTSVPKTSRRSGSSPILLPRPRRALHARLPPLRMNALQRRGIARSSNPGIGRFVSDLNDNRRKGCQPKGTEKTTVFPIFRFDPTSYPTRNL